MPMECAARCRNASGCLHGFSPPPMKQNPVPTPYYTLPIRPKAAPMYWNPARR